MCYELKYRYHFSFRVYLIDLTRKDPRTQLLGTNIMIKVLKFTTGPMEQRGQGGRLPSQFFRKKCKVFLKFICKQGQSEFIAPLILRASTGPMLYVAKLPLPRIMFLSVAVLSKVASLISSPEVTK